jgi:hypothetical protein
MPQNALAPTPVNSLVSAYKQYIGDPFAAVVGGGARGMLGFSPPEYGGQLGQEAYRTGQAIGVMPAVAAPVGMLKGAAKVPVFAERLLKEQSYYGRPMQKASGGILTYMPPEKFLSLVTTGTDVEKRAKKMGKFDPVKLNEDYLPYLDITFGGNKPSQVISHEGRARAARAMMDGVEQIPVVISSKGVLFKSVNDLPQELLREKSKIKIRLDDVEPTKLLVD